MKLDAVSGVCIGGPRAGTYVTALPKSFVAPIVPKIESIPLVAISEMKKGPVPVEYAIYQIRRFRLLADQYVHFWVLDTMTDLDVMVALAGAYVEQQSNKNAYVTRPPDPV